MVNSRSMVALERLERSILLIRNRKVTLSVELASLYQVEPRALIQAVKRNLNRFPGDFMFQLTAEEWENLKSQFVISSCLVSITARGDARPAGAHGVTRPT